MLEAVSIQVPVSPATSRQFGADVDVQQQGAVATRQRKIDARPANSTNAQKDSVQISEAAREISKLAARDREVRTHEAAHAAAGGAYAGAPSLTYQKGPDGRSYASGGEVSIDTSPVSGDPLATLQKAQVIRAAALAPAQPSGQDMRVASKASSMAAKASAELASQNDHEDSPDDSLVEVGASKQSIVVPSEPPSEQTSRFSQIG